LVELDTWREESHAVMMKLLFHDGQRSAALKQYETCRKILAAELDIEPQIETTQLYAQIKNNSLPALEIQNAPTNLPAETTTFIGREMELELLADRLQSTDCRLVTLTGQGGAGKSRLALQAAKKAQSSFRDGVFWVSLSGVENSQALPLAIIESLGLNFSSSQNPPEQLHNYLRQKELLLVLDNFEHLLDGADFVIQLLKIAPNVTVLITSREPLQVLAEWLLDVGGLSVSSSDSDDVAQVESIRLFDERAQRIESKFNLLPDNLFHVARLCKLLDGIPLGIELAAGWTRLFTCEQIADRIEQDLDFLASQMRDVPERHRSLRAVFDQSWDLLSPKEQIAFAKLSMFVTDFDLAAANQICKADEDALRSLWLKSLIRKDTQERYSLHPLLKQYADVKLNEMEDASAQGLKQYQTFYSELSMQLENEIQSPRLKHALERFTVDLENMLKAWNLALSQNNLDVLNAMLTPLFWYYEIFGRIYEGHILFRKVSEAFTENDTLTIKFQKRLAARYAWMMFRRGELEESARQLQDLVENDLKMLDENEQIFTLTRLGSVVLDLGQKQNARRWLEDALRLCEKSAHPWEESLFHNHYGSTLSMLDEVDKAERHLKISFEIAEKHGFIWIIASALSNLAVVAYFREDYRTAIDIFMQSDEKSKQVGDEHHGPSINHNNLADCYLQLGELEKAREHLNLALYHFKECGNTVFLPYVYNTLAGINLQDGKLNEAKQNLDFGIQSALEHNMPSVLNNLFADYARYYFLREDGVRSAALVRYVLKSTHTIKEGKDKAIKLEAEITEKFGTHIWMQISAAVSDTYTDALKLIEWINL
ncbi:MAG: tetratricopeptide repeat protein, partial [Anaerolineales bacterium]|nr:tetratricopeptide repeat protein [Anaerolineales bacterium]